jgi:hypothetical protein
MQVFTVLDFQETCSSHYFNDYKQIVDCRNNIRNADMFSEKNHMFQKTGFIITIMTMRSSILMAPPAFVMDGMDTINN